MKRSDILNRAAEIMIERGHAKGNYVNDDGRVCLLGALCAATWGDRNAWHFWDLKEIPGFAELGVVTGYERPQDWNDREETTEAMAIGALHEAALLAKEVGQ